MGAGRVEVNASAGTALLDRSPHPNPSPSRGGALMSKYFII
jgi:hypothetical protein